MRADGKPTETAAQTWNVATDDQGRASLEFKASESGQYRLSYKLTDAKKQTIEGGRRSHSAGRRVRRIEIPLQ